MTKISALEEFFHRKSDGIGMSDRYPRTAEVLETIMSLLPKGISDFDDEDVSRVAGQVVERGLKLNDLMSNIASDGVLKVVTDQARDKCIKDAHGQGVATAVKEVIEVGSGVTDRLKDSIFVAVGVAATLSTYDLLIKANDKLHTLDHIWHERHGMDRAEGSDLHKWSGGQARTKDTRSLAQRANPFLPQPIVQNPFKEALRSAPDRSRDSDISQDV